MDIIQEQIFKKKHLQENMIYYKDITATDLAVLGSENSKYFFDTENCPVFEQELIDKYDLRNVEYNTLPEFKIPAKEDGESDESYKIRYNNSLITRLKKEKKIRTHVYMWMFGNEKDDKVYWGNSIEEFFIFIDTVHNYKKEQEHQDHNIQCYVHNLKYDISMILYWLRENKYTQYKAPIDAKEKRKAKTLEHSWDIVEGDNTVYLAVIQNKKVKIPVNGRKKSFMQTLTFVDSAKITPMSLKQISTKILVLDEVFTKDGSEYRYNLYRDEVGYVPNDIEMWYCYCDIFLLKEWYRQFVVENYISQGIEPYTISQIAFQTILANTYDSVDRSKYKGYFDKKTGKEIVNDRVIYETDFGLQLLEKCPSLLRFFDREYKGGITTVSSYYRDLADDNKHEIHGVGIDITSSYPDKVCNWYLPLGFPVYTKSKYVKGKNLGERPVDKYRGKDKLDYHVVQIAFDGFTSKIQDNFDPNGSYENQFGLIALHDLTEEQQAYLGLQSVKEYATNNLDKNGRFIGTNRPTHEVVAEYSKDEKAVYDSVKDHRFIIAIAYNEFLELEKSFNFYTLEEDENGEEIEHNSVIFLDYTSQKSVKGYFAKGMLSAYRNKELYDKPESEGGNKGKKEAYKLVCNSFYGKNGASRKRKQVRYDFTGDENSLIKHLPTTDRDTGEILTDNVTAFEDDKLYAKYYAGAITSCGRIHLRRVCRLIGSDKFIYAVSCVCLY